MCSKRRVGEVGDAFIDSRTIEGLLEGTKAKPTIASTMEMKNPKVQSHFVLTHTLTVTPRPRGLYKEEPTEVAS